MLNRGYAYATIISSKYHGQTLLSHLASLYPHSTPQGWQQKLNNGEVTLNGVTATGSESVTSGQTLVWNRPSWIGPDAPQHFEILFVDSHLLAVNKPSGLPTLSCTWCKSNSPTQTLSTGWAEAPAALSSSPKHRKRPLI
jgi:23S rRNA pseudouridine1911/1915/1917 synthase